MKQPTCRSVLRPSFLSELYRLPHFCPRNFSLPRVAAHQERYTVSGCGPAGPGSCGRRRPGRRWHVPPRPTRHIGCLMSVLLYHERYPPMGTHQRPLHTFPRGSIVRRTLWASWVAGKSLKETKLTGGRRRRSNMSEPTGHKLHDKPPQTFHYGIF